MHEKSNRKVERFHLRIFSNSYPLPTGAIVSLGKPGANLEGGSKTKIVISNFLLQDGRLPRKEQIQARAREHVVSEAQRLYQMGNVRKMTLVFGFDVAHPIRNLDHLIKRLVDLAKRVEGRETGLIERELLRSIPELSFLYLVEDRNPDSKWCVDQLHGTPILTARRLRKIIRTKEAQSRNGRDPNVHWLLVVVDFMKCSEGRKIEAQDRAKPGFETFEKIVVIRTIFGNVFKAK